MSFIGYWSAPVSIPRVFDTTPCLQHMLEYEDCVGDVESIKIEYFMPTWPTLWPEMENGTTNRKIDFRGAELQLFPGDRPVPGNDFEGLNSREKQLLYECEEERMVYKACLRELIKLKRNNKMKSWDTAEISNIYLV